MKKLSILIPSTYNRQNMLDELMGHLKYQIDECGAQETVEILTDIDGGECSIGNKRQRLLEAANGSHVVFIDSDDWTANDYVEEILLALKQEPDVVGMEGWMTHEGVKRENFKISKNLPYITVSDANGNNEYLRFNNHLCAVKRDIALKIGFQDKRFAEDYCFALRLKNSGLIKTEVYIPKFLYHYRYIKNKDL